MNYIAYKRHLRRIRRNCGLYATLIERLKKLPKAHKSGIIRLPWVFQTMCGGFHISKQQSWDLLLLLHEFGVIELIPFTGIRILKKSSLLTIKVSDNGL
jgi:hypothetical protein